MRVEGVRVEKECEERRSASRGVRVEKECENGRSASREEERGEKECE